MFGLVAGVLELWADWVHVVYFHSLVYTDYFGFHLLASPSYMPIAWWLTVVQFGYLALRLADSILAATALENDLELVSRNVDDFKWIAGLRLVNPFDFRS